MTAKASKLGAASYELESSWGEDVNTYGTRLQVHGDPIVPTDIQARIAEPITQQYDNEGKLGVRGPWQGEFSITLALTGHGGTTTGGGALTDTDLYLLLKNAIGGGQSDQTGSAVGAGSPSASSIVADAGTALNAGGLVRIGAQGDGRGGGQFAALAAAATTAPALLTAIGGTPSDGDLIYAPLLVYPIETCVAIEPTRWLLQTANGQVSAHGCYPMGISITGNNHGEQLTVSITYGVSRWAERNEVFPDLTATDAKDASIVAGGSFYIQDVGTATRQELNLRQWALNLELQTTSIMGPGGLDGYQVVTGASRIGMSANVDITVDSEASGSNTLRDIFTGAALQQLLISSSIVDGKAIGFYFPNCRMTGYPNQENLNDLNRVSANFEALTGPDKTTVDSAASFVIGMA